MEFEILQIGSVVNSVVKLDRDSSAQSLLRSSRIELFESVELYLGDGLEMAACSVNIREETAQTLLRSPRQSPVSLYS